MRKEDLREYISLKREADICESELKTLRKRAEEEKTLARKINPLRQRALKMRKLSLDKASEIEGFISSCPDSYMRQILFLRYIKGYSWDKVAYKAGGRNKGDTVRKMAERYVMKTDKRGK